MQQYLSHLLVACLLGLCEADIDPVTPDNPAQPPQCICKPVMRIEWEPSSSICNNATVDWLLQTVLAQVSKQSDELAAQTEQVDQLQRDVRDKDGQISSLQQQVRDLERSASGLKDENSRLQDDLEDSKQHRAHLSPRPRDCADVQRYGFHYSGIYTVYPRGGADAGLEVFCDLNTDGGRWTVFQRRQDGSQAFNKLWDDYKAGFGTLAKEFWLGNEALHLLSSQRSYELRVDLTDYEGARYYAVYDVFSVSGEDDLYRLRVGEYSGDAGDSLSHHNEQPFSTSDKDNDQSRSGNCSELYGGGGWWYARCYDANLNGMYSDRHLYETTVWHHLRQNHEPMRHTEMKIRPRQA